jgi:large subunit ribosomal protein L33
VNPGDKANKGKTFELVAFPFDALEFIISRTHPVIYCRRLALIEVVDMAKGKEARSIIKLKSEASDHCYFTQKNRNNSKERLQLRKYDPIVRKHVMYKEASKV